VTVTAADIAAAARALVGTPFVPKGRVAGVGTDCKGVMILATRACGIAMHDDLDYAFPPDPESAALEAATRAHLTMRIRLGVGRVLGFSPCLHGEKGVQHFAIQTSDAHPGCEARMVHCRSGRGVREETIDRTWLQLLRATYRLPGVTY